MTLLTTLMMQALKVSIAADYCERPIPAALVFTKHIDGPFS